MSTAQSNLDCLKASDTLTPAMRQYVEQKAAVPDALLLFRMGDFYETFYEDAQTAARVLGITLTSRGKDKNGAAVPLAGIPYHALESYLSKLVRAGLKVAISEQVEDPKTAKGVVKREVVRIVTPGTLTDDALLEQRADNYLACVCLQRGECGLAFVELSTGAFCVQATDRRELLDELVRLGPAELLLADLPIGTDGEWSKILAEITSPGLPVTKRPVHLFDPYQAEQQLRKHFGVATLEGFGFDRVDASICAAAVIIDYLTETQKTALQHITKLTRRETNDYVCIDQSTWRALEIERTLRSGATTGSLLQAVDRTSSVMGARCLRRWLAAPLRDSAAIKERQDAIAYLLNDRHRLTKLQKELSELADIERITARLGLGRASPRDLAALGQTLIRVEKIAGALIPPLNKGQQLTPPLTKGSNEHPPLTKGGLGGVGSVNDCETEPPFLDSALHTPSWSPWRHSAFIESRCQHLIGLHQLGEFLTQALLPDAPLVMNEGGIISGGHDAELDRLRTIGTHGRQWLSDYQAREIERTGIGSLKVGYNQVFGYYIEITHLHRERVPADYVRKQTIKNAERYITDELKKYENEALTARDQAIQREIELFEQIRRRAATQIPAMQQLASAVAEIDVVAGLADLADERRYVRPELVDDLVLEIADGRHPVLEQTLGEKFVPNDCTLGQVRNAECGMRNEEPRSLPNSALGTPHSALLMILTGPNMAGKSTYIRQVALLTLLAQTGSYVPAASMRFTPVDRIFARIGASDEITRGQSTFMVEMTEAANILNNASSRSLVILDELGRGTSTFDGLSLAWAIAERLVKTVGCRALFATHYHELTELENYLAGVVNYNVAVREWQEEIVFLYRIIRGGADRSYGVHVAKLAGIPPAVITRARQLLAELEQSLDSTRRTTPLAAERTKPQDQPTLFKDPAEEVLEEITALDPYAITPLDALKLIEKWRSRLKD